MRTLRTTTQTAGQPARGARHHGEYGMIAEFTGPEPLVEATKLAFTVGYRRLDAYTPFPVHGLAEAMGRRGIRIPLIVLAGGIIGGWAASCCKPMGPPTITRSTSAAGPFSAGHRLSRSRSS